jgi:hypothetical protein
MKNDTIVSVIICYDFYHDDFDMFFVLCWKCSCMIYANFNIPVVVYLRIECILLKFHWGMKALTEVHFQWIALHVENVVRSTLSCPNETSKEFL